MEDNGLNTPQSAGDDYIIGKDFNIDEIPVEESGVKTKKKSGRRMPAGLKASIWIVSIIVVSVALAFGVIFAASDYFGIGFDKDKYCEVVLEEGTSTARIAEKLEQSGAIKLPLLFRLYSKVKGYDKQYKYGVYNFKAEIGYSGIANMLMNEGAEAKSVKVTIPEGSNIDDIAKLLSDAGVCEKADFFEEVRHGEFNFDFINDIPEQEVYYRLEGYLFPETYNFYCYDSKKCAHLAVAKMLETLDKRIQPYKDQINTSGYTFHEIMTMASIVELEAGGSGNEMANVAAVFFNRLKSNEFSTLGSSPTRKYPYGNNRYNTYVCDGLPVGPLCSPGLASIKATLEPTEDFDYYYFVTDASMKFYYNKTLKQHNATIAKLKAEKNWIYED